MFLYVLWTTPTHVRAYGVTLHIQYTVFMQTRSHACAPAGMKHLGAADPSAPIVSQWAPADLVPVVSWR